MFTRGASAAKRNWRRTEELFAHADGRTGGRTETGIVSLKCGGVSQIEQFSFLPSDQGRAVSWMLGERDVSDSCRQVDSPCSLPFMSFLFRFENFQFFPCLMNLECLVHFVSSIQPVTETNNEPNSALTSAPFSMANCPKSQRGDRHELASLTQDGISPPYEWGRRHGAAAAAVSFSGRHFSQHPSFLSLFPPPLLLLQFVFLAAAAEHCFRGCLFTIALFRGGGAAAAAHKTSFTAGGWLLTLWPTRQAGRQAPGPH